MDMLRTTLSKIRNMYGTLISLGREFRKKLRFTSNPTVLRSPRRSRVPAPCPPLRLGSYEEHMGAGGRARMDDRRRLYT